VIIVDEILSYADVLSIYASCDVFVSLHRSEGLGLCLMEAMTLGKAVVSTAWSGNMDFTNDQNACLVEYDLIPAVSTHPAYDPATLEFHPSWAEARVDHAAACLLRLRDDSNLRRKLGATPQRSLTLPRVLLHTIPSSAESSSGEAMLHIVWYGLLK
jgi:glycosyltransferase involved in cell wall biosynthesis